MNKISLKFRFPVLALAALALGTLSGCVESTSQSDMNSLYQRVNQHDQQIRALSSQAGQGDNVLSGQAEIWSQVQSMRQDINSMKGQFDEFNQSGGGQALGRLDARVARLEAALRQMASELGMKVEALDVVDGDAYASPGGAVNVATQPYTPDSSQPSAVSSGAAASDTATTLYESGTKAFGARRYKDGIKIFDDFVTAYPTHKLASNAYFWQGECYYQLKDYARAALAYNNVIEKYPGSGKYQSAMLKQGMAMIEAGKKDGGKVRLNELIAKYPKSPEAARAKTVLQQNP